MDHNYFPYGFLIWLFIKFLSKSGNNEPEVDANRIIIQDEHKMKIKYISNGRELNGVSAFWYYLNMLDLEVAAEIDNETIKSASNKRYQLINKLDYEEEWPIATRDVKAARAYLLDRWSYMTSFN